MAKRVKIPGRLESAETGNIVTGADAVMDDAKGKTQVVINSEVDAAIISLAQGKQDALTFDSAPTEGSHNPVTSAGVYTADKVLSDAIEAILLLIPSAASALNKLVDMQTMNSSIATATASFKGTYNLVSDLHLGVDATHEQIGAALDALNLGADNNDYAFVQVPNSATAPTEIRVTERYKFNGTNWLFEYDLNNSGFTQGQWNAINSGVTSLLVGKLSDLPTNAELTTMLEGKQDNLTFDNVPTAGSPNPVKSGGVYARNNEIVALINALDAAKQDVLTFDNAPVEGSPNPVKSGGVYAAISAVQAAVVALDAEKQNVLTFDSTPMLGSFNPVTSSGIKTELNRIDGNITTLNDLYEALTQSALVVVQPTDTWPVASPATKTIYRVVDRVNTPPQYYSDYMWNGTAMVQMATYDNAIDDEPTAGSNNLVKSGGVEKYVLQRILNSEDIDKTIRRGVTSANNGYLVTPYIDVTGLSKVWYAGGEGGASVMHYEFNCFDENKDYIQGMYWSMSTGRLINFGAEPQGSSVKYVRATMSISNIKDCIIRDETGHILWEADIKTPYDISLINSLKDSTNSNTTNIGTINSTLLDKLYGNATLYKALRRGEELDISTSCITPYISIDGISKIIWHSGTDNVQLTLSGYDENKEYIEGEYWSMNVERTVTGFSANTKYIRATMYLPSIDDCFIKDADGNILWDASYASKQSVIDVQKEVDSIKSTYQVPSYYDTYMDEKVGKIFDIQKNNGVNNDSLIFFTDTHDLSDVLKSPLLIKELIDRTATNKVFFGGDVAPADGDDSEPMQESAKLHNKAFDSFLSPVSCVFNARGNHDFTLKINGGGYVTLPKQTTYDWLIKRSELEVVGNDSDPSGCYYYVDNKKQKIRYIVADTIDRTDPEWITGYGNFFGVTSPQLDWIGNIALKTTPAGYGIVIVTHIELYDTIGSDGANNEAIQFFKRLLDLFNSRTSGTISGTHQPAVSFDFTNVDSSIELLMYLCGHEHMDCQTFADGYLSVCSMCDCKVKDGMFSMLYTNVSDRLQIGQRTAGTVYEQSFDYINIDKTNKIISFVKIGAGHDRRFNITPITLSVGGSSQLTSVLSNPSFGSYNSVGNTLQYNQEQGTYYWDIVNTIVSVNSSGIVTANQSGEAVVYAMDAQGNQEFFYIKVQ